METEERKTPFNRLKDIKNRYSTEEIVCGRVLREFEEKTDKAIKQIENKKETLKPQEKNNSKAKKKHPKNTQKKERTKYTKYRNNVKK